MSQKKLWASRFKKDTADILLEFTESVSFDKRLALHDIRGSLAHIQMLKSQKILSTNEYNKIKKGLKEIENEIRKNKFKFDPKLEDVHMNIEQALIKKIGPIGGKLHTARSRNDQVAVDTKLYLKDEILAIKQQVIKTIKQLVKNAERDIDIIIPGYTHLQQAQPISAAHYFLAYAYKFKRDLDNLNLAFQKTDILPLGVGALAGVNYNTNRKYLAELLNFKNISENSLDTVSDRDYQSFFLYTITTLQIHLSRFSEDLIIYNSNEFQYIDIDDAFTTGSSIMPNKKNPDILELIRGKTGRQLGNLNALLVTLKGLPMTYNRDLQEDKLILFDSIDSIKLILEVFNAFLKNIKWNKEPLKKALENSFMLATDVADYLVNKGLPFREAHLVSGQIVQYCINNKTNFTSLTLNEYKKFHKLFGKDVFNIFNFKKSINKKLSQGSTSIKNIKKQINKLKKI